MTARYLAPLVLFFAALIVLPACNTLQDGEYAGFGNYQRPIATESETAQTFFNQGMQLLYGFNHDEAIRSFEKAAQADPTSPMPHWGIAYANGININDPAMTE